MTDRQAGRQADRQTYTHTNYKPPECSKLILEHRFRQTPQNRAWRTEKTVSDWSRCLAPRPGGFGLVAQCGCSATGEHHRHERGPDLGSRRAGRGWVLGVPICGRNWWLNGSMNKLLVT